MVNGTTLSVEEFLYDVMTFISFLDEPGPAVIWWFTTEGLVSLTLMGILGFNVIVIIFALLFCACNRTKKAFEMEIWDYADALAAKKKEDEFLP